MSLDDFYRDLENSGYSSGSFDITELSLSGIIRLVNREDALKYIKVITADLKPTEEEMEIALDEALLQSEFSEDRNEILR